MNPLFVTKIMRDETYVQDELAPRVLRFRDMLLAEYNKMAAKPIF